MPLYTMILVLTVENKDDNIDNETNIMTTVAVIELITITIKTTIEHPSFPLN